MTIPLPTIDALLAPPAPENDPGLPLLAAALDPGAVLAAVAPWFARIDLTVAACRPAYIRYKPGTNATIRHDLEIGDGAFVRPLPLVLRLFPSGRAERQLSKSWVFDAVTAAGRLSIAEPVCVLPGLDAVAMRFPVDWKLSGLPAVAGGTAGAHEPELVRYKPGRKALFRAVAGASGETVYAKVFEPQIADAMRAVTYAFVAGMIAVGVDTPVPIGRRSELGLTLFPNAAGVPLRSLRNTSAYVAALPEVVALLRRLRSAPVALPLHRLDAEAAALTASAATLGHLLPARRPSIDLLAERLRDRLTELDDTLTTAHGDFYDDQFVVGSAGLTLIDADDVRLAHPALDAGNFLAHLYVERLRHRESEAVPAREALALLTADWAAELGERPLAVATAAGILKLAPGPFRRLEPEWPDRVAEIVELAANLVPGPPSTTGRPIDLALPGLGVALDQRRIAALLPPGDGSTLSAPRLVKHRPGRRAVVHYPLADRSGLYVKVFASDRASRVAERTRAIGLALGETVVTPRVLFFAEMHRLVGVSAVEGVPFDHALNGPDGSAAARVGAALADFHGSRALLDTTHTVEDELKATRRQLDALATLDGGLEEAARKEFAAVAARLRACAAWRSVPIHRDCHPAQILLTPERVGFVDLDDACLSEPAVDVGNLIAHLDLLAIQRPALAGRCERAAPDLLTGYRAVGGTVDDELLAACRAIALVRLVGVHAPRSGVDLGERLLRVAQGALASRR